MDTIAPPTYRGRLAPSPTGNIHLGNAFAFLVAYACARKHHGSLVMRMEDIDPDRSRPEFAQGIINDLHWLGLSWDEGPASPQPENHPHPPYWQGQALPLYQAALVALQQLGLIYPCFCTRKELKSLASAPHNEDGSPVYSGHCRHITASQAQAFIAQGRPYSLRLNVESALAHRIRQSGPTCCQTETQEHALILQAGDFALMRSDKVPAYQLAVVVDDGRMGITEVVRGNDLASSTPRQKLLLSLLGYTLPTYRHLPLVCNHLGERLAKRHKGLEVAALRARGVLPEKIIGLLAYLAGLSPTLQTMSARDFVAMLDMSTLTQQSIILPENVETLLL